MRHFRESGNPVNKKFAKQTTLKTTVGSYAGFVNCLDSRLRGNDEVDGF
jgi:hypothetical protein